MDEPFAYCHFIPMLWWTAFYPSSHRRMEHREAMEAKERAVIGGEGGGARVGRGTGVKRRGGRLRERQGRAGEGSSRGWGSSGQ